MVLWRSAVHLCAERWVRFSLSPGTERLFALLTAIVMLFTFLPWRSYRITFGDSERKHGIYSDDFALILVGCVVAAVPLLARLLPKISVQMRSANFWRSAGISIVVLFALWNIINPHRTGATSEATASWPFFVFICVVVVWSITGFLGVRAYAPTPDQKPDKS